MNFNNEEEIIRKSMLGVNVDFTDHYSPNILYPIPRHLKRSTIGIDKNQNLPFYGFDTWNDYETSWLNSKGKPLVGITTFHIPCYSPNIIESKSLKLYLNSLSNTQFSSKAEVTALIIKDLSRVAGAEVGVTISDISTFSGATLVKPSGINIDHLDLEIDCYEAMPNYLGTSDEIVTETLYSDLLKSNCPVTSQPDWATLIIDYHGPKLQREGLLKYIVSLRNQHEFHEQCIERIFMDLLTRCQPSQLTVTGRYTRRGGKDINPYRSTDPTIQIQNQRLIRQ